MKLIILGLVWVTTSISSDTLLLITLQTLHFGMNDSKSFIKGSAHCSITWINVCPFKHLAQIIYKHKSNTSTALGFIFSYNFWTSPETIIPCTLLLSGFNVTLIKLLNCNSFLPTLSIFNFALVSWMEVFDLRDCSTFERSSCKFREAKWLTFSWRSFCY